MIRIKPYFNRIIELFESTSRVVDGGSGCLQGLQRGWFRESRETGRGRQTVSASCLRPSFVIGCCQVMLWHHLTIIFGTAFLSKPYVMMQTQ